MTARRRLLPAALAALAVLPALLVAPVPGADAAGPARAPAQSPLAAALSPRTAAALPAQEEDAAPVAVVVESLTPVSPRPGQRLRISGRVVNGGEATVRDVGIELWADTSPLGSRSELTQAAEVDDALSSAGSPVAGTRAAVAPQLREGEGGRFTISVPMNRLGFDTFGVYPVGLQVTGVTSTGFGTVGAETTFLPWTPAGSRVQPTEVALLWPLVGRPWRDARGVFRDESLGSAVARGGRLRLLLDSGDDARLTWAVDPALLEAVADMADGYRVHRDDDTVSGTHRADARAWLQDARDRLGTGDLVTLPYADPDVVAQRRWKLGTDLTLATTLGPTVASEVLGRTVASDVAWPPGGRIDRRTLARLRAAGTTGVLLESQARPVDPALPYTPTGRAPVRTRGGEVRAGLMDETLSDLLGTDTSRPGEALLTRQRVLAETAMITAEQPQNSRAVLAVPPRRWSPDPELVGPLLDALRVAPWVETTTVSDLLARPDAEAERGPLDYGREARQDELDADFLLPVRRLRLELERFAGILAPSGGESTAAYDRAILRSESSAWRRQPKSGRALRNAVQDDLEEDRGDVYVAADRLVTLTSKSGRFPVTIANDLDQPVDVTLDLSSRQQTRLAVTDQQVPRIGAHRKVTVEVPAQARANGVVVVDAQLRTRDGEPYGQPVAIDVRATEYGTIAYVITAGALVVLFVAAGVRLGRRAVAARRRARAAHGPPGPGSGPDGSDGTGGSGGEPPGSGDADDPHAPDQRPTHEEVT